MAGNPRLLNLQLDEQLNYLSKAFREYDATDNVVTTEYLTYPNTAAGGECLKRIYRYEDGVDPTLVTSKITSIDTWTSAMENAAKAEITDIQLSSLEVSTDAPVDTVVATITSTGGTGAITYVLTADVDDKFKISGDQLLVKNTIGSTPTTHNITIKATDELSKEYSESFTITTSAYSNSNSISFDGVNERCTFSRPADMEFTDSDTLSFSMWIKPDTIVQMNIYDNIFFGGFRLTLQATGKIRMQVNGSSSGIFQIDNDTVLTTGNWYHVVFTYDGSGNFTTGANLYINSSSASTVVSDTTPTGNFNGYASPTVGTGVFGSPFFDGNIDEFSVYSTELSAGEVSTLYNSGNTTDAESVGTCIHWWRMGDGATHPTIPDEVGSADMTMTNMDASNITTDVP